MQCTALERLGSVLEGVRDVRKTLEGQRIVWNDPVPNAWTRFISGYAEVQFGAARLIGERVRVFFIKDFVSIDASQVEWNGLN